MCPYNTRLYVTATAIQRFVYTYRAAAKLLFSFDQILLFIYLFFYLFFYFILFSVKTLIDSKSRNLENLSSIVD